MHPDRIFCYRLVSLSSCDSPSFFSHDPLHHDLGSEDASETEYVPWYALPETFWQVTHFLSRLLTTHQIDGIQYLCWTAVMTLFTLPCSWLIWIMLSTSLVSGCFDFKRNGHLVNSLTGALCILPPQWIYPLSSRNRWSCLTSNEHLTDLDFSYLCSQWKQVCWQS